MVDRTDLQRANMMYSELNMIQQAIANLAAGGVITAVAISPGPLPDPVPEEMRFSSAMGPTVSTIGMPHPPAMLDSIRTMLQQRQGQIVSELQGMGITGVTA